MEELILLMLVYEVPPLAADEAAHQPAKPRQRWRPGDEEARLLAISRVRPHK